MNLKPPFGGLGVRTYKYGLDQRRNQFPEDNDRP
jgi:hypothetical protein